MYVPWEWPSALLYVWEASRNVERELSQSPSVIA